MLLQDYHNGIFVTGQSLHVVDSDFNPIGRPPIFQHHSHFLFGPGLNDRSFLHCLLLRQNEQCFQEYTVFDVHGDRQCVPEEGGLVCLEYLFDEGYGMIWKESPGFSAAFLDILKANSPSLEWYVEHSFQWIPNSGGLRPLSRFIINAAAHRPHNKNSESLTFRVPDNAESFNWQAFVLPFSGQMKYLQDHNHGHNFHGTLLFDATPKDLGLDAPWFKGPSHTASTPSEVGLTSNSEVKNYIFRNLNYSQMTHSNALVPAPSLKCEVQAAWEIVNNIRYPRRSQICCRPWVFRKGAVFTRVLFFNQTVENTTWIRHHAEYAFYYESNDGLSHYNSVIGYRRPESQLDNDGVDFYLRGFTEESSSLTSFLMVYAQLFYWCLSSNPLTVGGLPIFFGIVLIIVTKTKINCWRK